MTEPTAPTQPSQPHQPGGDSPVPDAEAVAAMLALSPAEVVAALTLEEKASLTSGSSFWFTEGVPRAGIPKLLLTDGPHGVRKQRAGASELGLGDSVPATCFPPAVALGSTFDAELVERIGVALGEEAAAEGVGVLLGPGINIKRTPLCGRNFEYLSEDPLVAGVLGAALVKGLQSQGIGASVKHFAANNQETDRMRVSADVDERPLREIYLRAFQRVVAEAHPWTIMCSYNRINGTYASQHPWLLTSVLRDEWGYDGLVMSDWGAVDDRVAGVAAGLDLEMPSSDGRTDAELVAAVRAGRLDEAVLDVAATRVVDLVQKAVRREGTAGGAVVDYDVDAHHALAREAAARSVVLLENDGILPLPLDASVAVIGAFATQPRYQGAGSSLINPTRLDRALDGIVGYAGQASVTYAAGFVLDAPGPRSGDESSAEANAEVTEASLVEEAVAAAAVADVAVLFLGLPAERESEGFDRPDLELPADQLALLDAVADANPRVVVVLSHGGVVRLADVALRAAAVVEGWLLGQAGGSAVADVLYGVVNPSGRLAETIPHRLADTPAHLGFPGERGHVRYGEGVFVGYRWYDARELDVAYPFGHGLSYTTFTYADLTVSHDDDGLTVGLTVTNNGERDGTEVVQVYAGRPESQLARAPRELVAFAAVHLAAGEARPVVLRVARHDLAHWDVGVGSWVLEGGPVTVEVGASSRDIRLRETVTVDGDDVRTPLSLQTSVVEVLAHPGAAAALRRMMGGPTGEAPSLLDDADLLTLVGSAPIGRIVGFPGTGVTPTEVAQLFDRLNGERGQR
ncbi:MAG: beta-glucosidase [Humibacillus sp.]|nr:beta-glucosidase [Humibacillus sp.]